jgi:hypothetical protein
MDGWVEMSYAWPPVMSILLFSCHSFWPAQDGLGRKGSVLPAYLPDLDPRGCLGWAACKTADV